MKRMIVYLAARKDWSHSLHVIRSPVYFMFLSLDTTHALLRIFSISSHNTRFATIGMVLWHRKQRQHI